MYLMESTSYVERRKKKKKEFVVLLLFTASTHSPASSHTERARSPGPTCRSANVKRGVEPELANRSHFREHTSYIPS